jgi:hypothetical protein
LTFYRTQKQGWGIKMDEQRQLDMYTVLSNYCVTAEQEVITQGLKVPLVKRINFESKNLMRKSIKHHIGNNINLKSFHVNLITASLTNFLLGHA